MPHKSVPSSIRALSSSSDASTAMLRPGNKLLSHSITSDRLLATRMQDFRQNAEQIEREDRHLLTHLGVHLRTSDPLAVVSLFQPGVANEKIEQNPELHRGAEIKRLCCREAEMRRRRRSGGNGRASLAGLLETAKSSGVQGGHVPPFS